jgi:hypothetical protein
MIQFIVWPGALFISIGFGIFFGAILHAAVEQNVYSVTRFRALDSYALSWLLGLAAAITPMLFYLAFGFSEFADTPNGAKLQERLRLAARLEVAFLVFYGAVVLLTVPQK